MQLPEPQSVARSWVVDDFGDTYEPAQLLTPGTLQAVIGPADDGELWLIDRAVVTCTSSTQTRCQLYIDVIDASAIVDGTTSGNADVADNTSPIHLEANSSLLAVWTNVAPASSAGIRAQWRVLRRQDG